MDARDFYRTGQGIRTPSSVEIDDQLFHTYFDWPAFINDTEPWDKSYQSPPPDFNQLITEIPHVIDRFNRMKTSSTFGSGSEDGAATSPGYSSHPSPPGLVGSGGSTSPSDHSGPLLPDQHEDQYLAPSVSLKDFRAHDDQWTLPGASPPKSARSGYSPQLLMHNHGLPRYSDQGPSHATPTLGRSHGKRQRQLENPDQTADVRKSGACMPCRLTKTRVSAAI